MCKHTDLLKASLSAVNLVRESLPNLTAKQIRELDRLKDGYTYILEDIDYYGCKSCKYDKQDPNRKSNYIAYMVDYVDNYPKPRAIRSRESVDRGVGSLS